MKLIDRFNKEIFLEQLSFPVQRFIPTFRDSVITAAILVLTTALGFALMNLGVSESNIINIYLLGVLLTAIFAKSYLCSFICSFLSVILFNYFFTEPRFTFHAYGSGYPLTFIIMLAASIIIGTLAASLRNYIQLTSQTAFATRVLLDTNRLLHQAKDENEIIHITSSQLLTLLNRNIISYHEDGGTLSEGILFSKDPSANQIPFFNEEETLAAHWVFRHGERAGATTDIMSPLLCLYLPVSHNNMVYGVVGVHIEDDPLDDNEYNIMMSILGEGALAIENQRNAAEKEKAAVFAKNEQLRSNLLRAISHDLRTPLTSISGNASSLISDFDRLDEEVRTRIFTDIYEDSQWLINLVENLLSITRIEDGKLHFNMSLQLMDEVLEEALRHINQNDTGHPITVRPSEDLLFVKMDAKLIVQVIINLVDNAMKHTPPGTHILITTKREGNMVCVSIADTGPGIPDELKSQVFEMFYTGEHKIADSRRSLGLGLPLSRSIIDAHNGTLTLTDNTPQGAIFTFYLPSGEVTIHE